tara:strand:- start:33 stop:329 length:297 start_codon:yes stop_codon:yes gene_type:complete
MKTILKKVGRDARKKLGPGKISFLHDKARPYLPLVKDEELSNLFEGGVQLAAGKAPDMSHVLDAGVCPFMEREVEKAGALTPNAICKVFSELSEVEPL